ncbi:MAG: hypothetical protein LBM60_01765 [Clostridium sp.]|nr:hypothetical protein [Clostridium sp.]
MESILHETIDLGAEIKRYMEEYSLVPPDPAFVDQYRMYYSELMRITGMVRKAYEKGYKSGYESSRDEAEGRLQERLRIIQALMDSMNMSEEQAMKALKIPESEMPRYIDLLQSQ